MKITFLNNYEIMGLQDFTICTQKQEMVINYV